ncbi:Hypothetical predicted protein, partial [Olea europaea subsp. europaea]
MAQPHIGTSEFRWRGEGSLAMGGVFGFADLPIRFGEKWKSIDILGNLGVDSGSGLVVRVGYW